MVRFFRMAWPWLVLACIVLIGAWFVSYRLAEPAWDTTGQHGRIMAEWPHKAANYLHFGYLATRLGVVTDYGWTVPQGGFDFGIDHPPVAPLLMSVSYLVFGVSEWSARLVPLLLSLGMVVLVFALARQMVGNGWALLASCLTVGMPALIYYARLPVPHVPSVFFALATFVAYRQWVTTGERKYLSLTWASFVVGSWTDWVVYFVMPWVVAHYLLFHYRRTRDRWFVLVSLVLPFVVFAAYVVWALTLVGKEGVGGLLPLFQYRMGTTLDHAGATYFTWYDLYKLSYDWVKLFFTPILCGLSVVWLISFLARSVKRRVSSDEFLIACLFLYGLTHNLVLRNRVYIHDFAMVYQWVPFFALAGMLGTRMLAHLAAPRWRRWAAFVLAPLVLVAFVSQSWVNLSSLQKEAVKPSFYWAGTEISNLVPRDGKLLASFHPDFRLSYYIDRSWEQVRTLDKFQAWLRKDSSFTHYVLGPDASEVSEELLRHLVANYPVRNCWEYTVFDLKGEGPRVLVENPAEVPRSANVRFGDNLLLTGYRLDPVSVPVAVGGEPSFWEKHFNPYVDLMPQYRIRFRVTYYWQCLRAMSADYRIVAQFVQDYDKEYVIDQTHWPANGAYPTSLWHEGDVVREEYVVDLPSNYPPLRYALRLSVVDPKTEEALEVQLVGETVSDDKRQVTLGHVELGPTSPLVGRTDPPQVQEPLVQDVGDNLILQGYDTGHALPAGQSLWVATSWLCSGPVSRDVPVWVELANGDSKVRALLGIEPTRLWQTGRYYVRQGELAVSPYLLPGSYDLNLIVGGSTTHGVKLGAVEVGWRKRPQRVVYTTGVANAAKGDVRLLDAEKDLQLDFFLDRPMGLNAVAGWTGEALCDETRVEVYLRNQYAERYLTTWQIPKGEYRVSSMHVPQGLTAEGANSIVLRVPESRPKPHYVGWRAWVDAILPDLLCDTGGPYDGWVSADFVQVSAGELGEEWAAYRDLAQAYNGLEMYGEVSRLFDGALAAGLSPKRAEDLNVFVNAFDKLGKQEGQRRIQQVLEGLVPHKLGLNLGDEVEVVGYGVERVDEERARLKLVFQCLKPLGVDYTVWLHQYSNAAGQDGAFTSLDHRLKTSSWKPGWLYEDAQEFEVRMGGSRFVFGLWRGAEGTRLEMKSQPGQHEIDLGWVEPK